MACIKRLILDVLKPHQPNALEFATALADTGREVGIKLTVAEVDEKTESIILVVDGEDINYDAIAERIAELGGTLHSIDEVEVASNATTGQNDNC